MVVYRERTQPTSTQRIRGARYEWIWVDVFEILKEIFPKCTVYDLPRQILSVCLPSNNSYLILTYVWLIEMVNSLEDRPC